MDTVLTLAQGAVGLTRMLAAAGQFRAFLGRQTRRGAPMGLLVTAGVVLVFFGIDTAKNEPATFVAILAITALAIVFNLLWAQPKPTTGPGASLGASRS